MLSNLFKKLEKENRAAFITFVSCGDPNLEFSEKLIERVCKSGADIIELGVPFSDPVADGPVIQAASLRAIKSGTTLEKVISMAKRLRERDVRNPFVLFSYYNLIYRLGIEKVAQICKDAQIDAMLVVDVPYEESEEIKSIIHPKGINFIPLAAPTTSLDRIKMITRNALGFLYYVTVSGVTGARDELPKKLAERLVEVRKVSYLPIAAGFGISNPQMAHEVALCADAVVVGSKLVSLIYDNITKYGEETALDEAGKFVKSLSSQMRR